MDSMAVWELNDALQASDAETRRICPGIVSDVDDEGVIWVRLVGSDEDTPVTSSTASVDKGDVVNVRVEGGRALIDGSTSNPSASVTALSSVDEKAVQALYDAATAAIAASNALDSAATAAAAAAEAQESADDAASAAASAQESADTAEADAVRAYEAAESATADAAAAHEAADSAKADAQTAFEWAQAAQEGANEAYNASLTASNAATSALTQLSTVEDVVGVIDWAQEHATYELTDDTEIEVGKIYWQQVSGYVLTTDTAVVQSKTYYALTGDGSEERPFVYDAVAPVGTENPSEEGWYEYLVTGYDPVMEPTAEGLSGYYDMSIVDALGNYVRSHLALTESGLYVLKDGSGYKTLLTNDDMQVLDAMGNVVASFGSDIRFSEESTHYIGNSDAFILFTPPLNNNPANIVIGGDNVIFNSDRSLPELLETIDNMRTDVGELDGFKDETAQWISGADSSISALDTTVGGISSDLGTVSSQLDEVTSRVVIDANTPAIRLNATGTSNPTFEAVLTSQSLTFRDHGQDVAWVSNQELYITDATVTDTLKFGSFAFIPRSNGNLALKWLG